MSKKNLECIHFWCKIESYDLGKAKVEYCIICEGIKKTGKINKKRLLSAKKKIAMWLK